MSILTIELIICIFSVPLLISLSFVTVSAPTLLVLTNINFSDIKYTCLNYKKLSTEYGLDQCFLPTTAILNNLFAILLVVSTVIMVLLCLKTNLRYKKKFKRIIANMTDQIEELHATNSGLHIEIQRISRNITNPPPLPQNPFSPPQTPYVPESRPLTVSPVLAVSGRDTDPLVDNLPDYGSVMGADPKSNENNLRSMKRFPSIINN